MYVMYMYVYSCLREGKCTFFISCVLTAPEVLSVFRRREKKEAMQLACTMHKHPLDITTLVRFYYRYIKNLLYMIYIRLLYV